MAFAIADGKSNLFYWSYAPNTTRENPGPFPPEEINGFNDYLCMGSAYQPFPTFSKTAAEINKQRDSVFHMLKFPQDDPRYNYLTRLTVGKVTATTLDNELYGVKGNRGITIHFMEIAAPLDLGEQPSTSLQHYGEMIWAIIATLSSDENAAVVNEMVLAPLGLA
jgi:hypothetical protein